MTVTAPQTPSTTVPVIEDARYPRKRRVAAVGFVAASSATGSSATGTLDAD